MGLWGSVSLLQFCTKFCGYLGFPWEKVHRFPHIHKGFYFLKAGNHWAIQRYLVCGSPLPRKPGVRNQGGMGEGLVMLRTKGGYLILIFPQVTFFLCSSGLTCLYLAAQQLHTKLTGGRENSETEPEFSGGQGLASCNEEETGRIGVSLPWHFASPARSQTGLKDFPGCPVMTLSQAGTHGA